MEEKKRRIRMTVDGLRKSWIFETDVDKVRLKKFK